jgi:hypothetical protein
MISCNMDLYNRTTRTYTDLLVWGASLLPTAAEGIRRGGHISIARSVGRPVATPDRRARCSRSSRQRLEERARVTEVGGLEAFGEPGIDRVQHGPGAGVVVLMMEQPRQTRRGA